MTKTKKYLALLFSCIMLFASFPVTAYAASKTPSKPTSVSATSTLNSVTVKWKKVSGATGYVVYKYDTAKKKYSKAASSTKTSCKISKLTSGKTYVYAVKAYKTVKKKKYYSSYSAKVTISTLPGKVTGLKKSTVSYSGINMKWNKVSGASGYKLQYGKSKSFSSGVKTVKTSAAGKNVTSLAANTTYYFRVYAYRIVNKKTYTSAVSAVVAVKTSVKPDPYAATKSTVSPSVTYQTMEGFGASAAWWAQKVGGWENADEFIKLLYSKDEGIGLNIYRYNLGGGSEKDAYIDHGKSAQSFATGLDNDGNLIVDMTKDANAQKALAIAKKYAGNQLQVSLFSNSAPAVITENNKTYCNTNDKSQSDIAFMNQNLNENNFAVYAKYLTNVADYFNADYRVVDVSPVNEPQYAWAADENGYSSQEGCHFKPTQLAKLLEECANAGAEKTYKFSMFESGAAEGEKDSSGGNSAFNRYLTAIMNNRVNKNYYNSVSTHSYWADKEGKQACRDYMDKKYPDMSVACTEYCQMTNDKTTGVWALQQKLMGFAYNGVSIEFGVQMARTIYEDLTVLNATQWNWWTAVSGGYYPDGLVYYDGPEIGDSAWDAASKTVHTSKRLWCLGNFSKFIEEGAVRVKITEAQSKLLSCAFKNPDGSLVIVYINQNVSDMKANVNVSGYKTYACYETSASKDLKKTASGAYAYKNSVSVPANSVVTVVLNK